MVGILGDGQLALMLGEAAEAQRIEFLAFGEDAESPFAVRFPSRFVKGSPRDSVALIEFAKKCSVLTLENEFLACDTLRILEKQTGVAILPDSQSYAQFESKISQRTFYQTLGIDGPRWTTRRDSIEPPCVVKANQGGYDGYGVRFVKNQAELDSALESFGLSEGKSILVEERVEIAGEFAQGALMDGKGNAIFLPLVETVQKNGICELVLTRPRLNESQLKWVSTKVKAALDLIVKSGIKGLFNFEFFLTRDGRVLINEGAPRPHNSQHVTLDASDDSQFSILMNFANSGKLPVLEGNTSGNQIEALPAAMINLLGQTSGPKYSLELPVLPSVLRIYPKLYLKKECRPGRKMGHLNLVDPSDSLNLVEFGEKILREYKL